MSGDDWLAALSLILLGLFGILLHVVESLTMLRLTKQFIGFRFILALSLIDVLLLIQFGVWPGLVILTKNTLLPIAWVVPVHIYLDWTWWAMCNISVVISLTRLACVATPVSFRRLTEMHCYLICVGAVLLALVQSIMTNLMPWFVPLYYDPSAYGMTCDWARYDGEGTSQYYLIANGIIMGSYLTVYSVTALIMLLRRKTISKMFNRAGKPKSSLAVIGDVGKQQLKPPALSQPTVQTVEIKLMLPCIAAALVFILGSSNWTGFWVMAIFSLQSILSPILRFAMSPILRRKTRQTLLYLLVERRMAPPATKIKEGLTVVRANNNRVDARMPTL